MSEEFQKDLTIYPVLDRMTFAMREGDIDWAPIDEISDADPSSEYYLKLMRELRITSRTNSGQPRRMKKDDYWD